LDDVAVLLDAIASLGSDGADPFTDPDVLATAAEIGLLDAPHLRGNAAACGKITTRMINGASLAVDGPGRTPIPEPQRVARALERASRAWKQPATVSAAVKPGAAQAAGV